MEEMSKSKQKISKARSTSKAGKPIFPAVSNKYNELYKKILSINLVKKNLFDKYKILYVYITPSNKERTKPSFPKTKPSSSKPNLPKPIHGQRQDEKEQPNYSGTFPKVLDYCLGNFWKSFFWFSQRLIQSKGQQLHMQLFDTSSLVFQTSQPIKQQTNAHGYLNVSASTSLTNMVFHWVGHGVNPENYVKNNKITNGTYCSLW